MSLGRTFAIDPSDSADVQLEKRAIFLMAASCSVAGLVWAAMYALVFGLVLTTALPLLFTVIVGAALGISHLTRKHHYAVYAQVVCILYITAFIQWSIGGLVDSGFVLVWSFCGPVTALVFFKLRQSAIWFVLYLVNVMITVAFDDVFAQRGLEVSDTVRAVFFSMNFSFASLVVFAFAAYFVGSASEERRRAEALLLNILPRAIASRLKRDSGTIADHYESASVMFADMVGSTPLFAGMSATETVDWLNECFSMFDRLIEDHGLEKIRTIGDNYMVAAGVPEEREDHARALTALALDMCEAVEGLPARNGRRMVFRFGIHSGPLVAGVIGESKFQYDLWGDTVNTASRMESCGEVGRVQVSAETHALIRDHFDCVARGKIEIKGKGQRETWFVERRRDSVASQAGS